MSGRDDAQQSTGGTTSVGQQLQQQFQERENEVAAQRTAFERRQKRRKVWSSRAFIACSSTAVDTGCSDEKETDRRVRQHSLYYSADNGSTKRSSTSAALTMWAYILICLSASGVFREGVFP